MYMIKHNADFNRIITLENCKIVILYIRFSWVLRGTPKPNLIHFTHIRSNKTLLTKPTDDL